MRIYFAGPLFTPYERSFIDQCAAQLRSEGFEVFVPHEIPLPDPVTAKFIFNEKDNDKIHNFIKIDRRGKNIKIWYIVNKDKVTKSKTYNMNDELSRIEIKNKDLCNLIFNSFQKYPREYLLEFNDKNVTPTTFLSWIRKITGVEWLNNDIMRSSYINWFYSTERNSNEKEELSRQMRHSVDTAQKNYLKIIE